MFVCCRLLRTAKKLPKSSQTATYVLYLFMLHMNGNVDKKFQLLILYRRRENHVSPFLSLTEARTFRIINILREGTSNLLSEKHKPQI